MDGEPFAQNRTTTANVGLPSIDEVDIRALFGQSKRGPLDLRRTDVDSWVRQRKIRDELGTHVNEDNAKNIRVSYIRRHLELLIAIVGYRRTNAVHPSITQMLDKQVTFP